jgi:hypothetical protein
MLAKKNRVGSEPVEGAKPWAPESRPRQRLTLAISSTGLFDSPFPRVDYPAGFQSAARSKGTDMRNMALRRWFRSYTST